MAATSIEHAVDPTLNPQVAGLRVAKTMALTDLARSMREAGDDVIGLAAGEADFDTPAPIVEAGVEALRCVSRSLRVQSSSPDVLAPSLWQVAWAVTSKLRISLILQPQM